MKTRLKLNWLVVMVFALTGLLPTARAFYAPTAQRWVNRDPIQEHGGLNLYGYIGNSPMDWVDPFGLEKGAELLVNMNNGFGGLNSLPGQIWNFPNTALGLLVGGLGIPFGAEPHFGNNALQFENHPFMFGGNITLGNVICYRGDMPSNHEDIENPPYTYGDHEEPHTHQGEQLGPFYFPAYVLFGLVSGLNGGEVFGHGNYMEAGPNSSPPQRWP